MLRILRKPSWLNKKIDLAELSRMQSLLKELNLHTVCQAAACPNIGECFSRGEATFMILGEICTRNCRFCNVKTGRPKALDREEPQHVAQAVQRLGLKQAVITSVTRDDLSDGGAEIFVQTVLAIREKMPQTKIELLIPDFNSDRSIIKKIVQVKPDIIGHNVETVPRLYAEVQPQANYKRSLKVLKIIKELDSEVYTKSGLMLGLGEKEQEVLDVLKDLRGVKCDFLSLGQYLSPSLKHYPVQEYIPSPEFDFYKKKALDLGFLHLESAPYVRTSYRASEYLKEVIG